MECILSVHRTIVEATLLHLFPKATHRRNLLQSSLANQLIIRFSMPTVTKKCLSTSFTGEACFFFVFRLSSCYQKFGMDSTQLDKCALTAPLKY